MISDKELMINELKTIVEPYIQDKEAFENLHEETDFMSDLKINSANLIDVILDVEDKYDIELDNDSMDKMLNIKAALEVINAKVSEK
ncbi:MAG: acyl carrier protein [Schleiferiaceae bacterium]|jgi:acyl carrier protein|nr:acyl carrier protein [Schleiferiaceae bacterium]